MEKGKASCETTGEFTEVNKVTKIKVSPTLATETPRPNW